MSTRDVPEQVGDLPRVGRPATSALLEEGVTSLEQVARWSRRDLLALHGVGPRAVRLLEEALSERGLALAEEPTR
ncbi:helix-hairpin-helix domain-containing protein [Desertihabitans aurantiacus]|uniref:hypothetical protein n=1 Tax=Desertihabitans aurantiacus TaxID=2282477 RepID=UPI000DF7CE04|nr:hypothetical protein [Desertihabitans aurantiacus]